MKVYLLDAFGVSSVISAFCIFCSHFPRTASTDLDGTCPLPFLTGVALVGSTLLLPVLCNTAAPSSKPAAILATFRLIGVLGSVSPSMLANDDSAGECDKPFAPVPLPLPLAAAADDDDDDALDRVDADAELGDERCSNCLFKPVPEFVLLLLSNRRV